MSIFFTADTHFNHANIIRYCNRPFQTTEEMDEIIISNWNKDVNNSDTVYHLGDFAFRDPKIYLKRLKGKIILIRGNHDYKYSKSTLDMFENVYDLITIKLNNIPITLCHFAMRIWPKSHFNSWHLYGHSHSTLETYGKSHDVGVDNNCFTPLSLETLEVIMENKPNNVNWLKKLKGYNEEEFDKVKKLVDSGIEVD
jgi:calcineurin-like phosphoesterase family protein